MWFRGPGEQADKDRWAEAIKGKPVRWIQEYLAEEQVIEVLSHQADVVTFWYRDLPSLQASGAARLGLASGVPVLAAQIKMFEDLREATYQTGDLHAGLQTLLSDRELKARLSVAARQYCERHTWERTARAMEKIWSELEARERD